ncbi:MAG TPA: aldo/keto reductase [Candidatus Limnocylindrales bacterium]|nr:aldo/keto reductase [Candidatus Limnocylindrales bacterium]
MKLVEVAGIRVSAIGLGTWQFGSGDWGYGLEYARVTAPAIVRRALELGVNLIDTAEAYGGGASELIIGSALRDAPRDPFVATKFTPVLPIQSVILDHAERSRRRLQVSAIDLYQIHWTNPLVPPSIQAAGLRRVLDRGIARHVGVSNHSLGRWQAMELALGRPVLSNQVELNLARPGALRALVPYAQAHDRLVIAYSPLGQGILAGSQRPHRNAARLLRRALGAPGHGRAAPLRVVLREIASDHGATMAQVALAWLIGHPNVVAIPGARTIEQLESNVAAASLELGAAERTRLSEASAAFAGERRPDASGRG